jgi:hypothetical protein
MRVLTTRMAIPVAGQILARERNNPGQSLRRQGPPAGARLALPNPPRASAGMLAMQYDRILTTKRPPEGRLCIRDVDLIRPQLAPSGDCATGDTS